MKLIPLSEHSLKTVEMAPTTKTLKIALLQLYSNGDCLFATTVAKQIKHDYPHCHLTWYISDRCESMIFNNPDIDEIHVIPIKGRVAEEVWSDTDRLLKLKQAAGEFDHYFSTQIIGDNEANYNGTIRGTILSNYPNPITVGFTPFIYLTDAEVFNVKKFVSDHKIDRFKNIVLFECAPISGQIQMNPQLATKIAEDVLENLKETCFILTSGEKIITDCESIFDASVLSIRENAELINHCTHLIGCSSGISWISISQWCKKLPVLQILDTKSFYFNSMRRDHNFFHTDASLIIEMSFGELVKMKKIISDFISDFKSAKQLYRKDLADHSSTIYTLGRRFIARGKTWLALKLIKNNYTLNKTNWHYYYKIFKLIFLSPIFVLSYIFYKSNSIK